MLLASVALGDSVRAAGASDSHQYLPSFTHRTERSFLCSPVPAAALALFAPVRDVPEVCPNTPRRTEIKLHFRVTPCPVAGKERPEAGRALRGSLPLPRGAPGRCGRCHTAATSRTGTRHRRPLPPLPRPCRRPAPQPSLRQSRPTPGKRRNSAGTAAGPPAPPAAAVGAAARGAGGAGTGARRSPAAPVPAVLTSSKREPTLAVTRSTPAPAAAAFPAMARAEARPGAAALRGARGRARGAAASGAPGPPRQRSESSRRRQPANIRALRGRGSALARRRAAAAAAAVAAGTAPAGGGWRRAAAHGRAAVPAGRCGAVRGSARPGPGPVPGRVRALRGAAAAPGCAGGRARRDSALRARRHGCLAPLLKGQRHPRRGARTRPVALSRGAGDTGDTGDTGGRCSVRGRSPRAGRGRCCPTCARRGRCCPPGTGRGTRRGGAGAASRGERLLRAGCPSGQAGAVPGGRPVGLAALGPGGATARAALAGSGAGTGRGPARIATGLSVAREWRGCGDAGPASPGASSPAEGCALGVRAEPLGAPEPSAAAEGTCPGTLPQKPEE